MNNLSIYIKAEELKEYNRLLAIEEVDFEKEGIKEDSTLKSINAVFSNGYEVDIKVCSGQTNCYVDAILFDDKGYELVVAEPSFELDGQYIFEIDGETYCVTVQGKESLKLITKYFDIDQTTDEIKTGLYKLFDFEERMVMTVDEQDFCAIDVIVEEYEEAGVNLFIGRIIEKIAQAVEATENYEYFECKVLDEEFSSGFMAVIAYVKKQGDYAVPVECEDVDKELIYTCDFCHTEIGWESGHSSKGNIWECEECGKMVCTSCIECHGGTTSETADRILCGDCQQK